MTNELQHHGILGMKWGVRRYQNPDGSLTPAGKKRYESDIKANNQKAKDKRVNPDDLNDPNRWVREDLTNIKSAADSGKISQILQAILKNDLAKRILSRWIYRR